MAEEISLLLYRLSKCHAWNLPWKSTVTRSLTTMQHCARQQRGLGWGRLHLYWIPTRRQITEGGLRTKPYDGLPGKWSLWVNTCLRREMILQCGSTQQPLCILVLAIWTGEKVGSIVEQQRVHCTLDNELYLEAIFSSHWLAHIGYRLQFARYGFLFYHLGPLRYEVNTLRYRYVRMEKGSLTINAAEFFCTIRTYGW